MREGGKRLRRLGLAALFMLAATAGAAQTEQLATGQRNLACGSPASIGDGWPTATPESVGLDSARLCGIAVRLKETKANVHAVIIVRHGKLVFEQYFPGYDEPWGMGEGRHDFDATTKHDMRSASKSVVSLLVGIAIDRELIKNADEPVLGNIIERVSGKSLDAFAREALFTPLGISDWEWMKYRNEHIAAAAGLRLRPRDAAKIGQLNTR
jgi:CubicO group peptidase (beta-lactamase class C family)